MTHNTPNFEQPPKSPEDWTHPVLERVATVLRAAESEDLQLRGGIYPDSNSEEVEQVLRLMSDGVEIASVHQYLGDDLAVYAFDFDFFTEDGQDGTKRSSAYFSIGGESVSVYLNASPEDSERLLAQSQLAIPLMRAVDNSLDGLLTAWVTDPENFSVQLLDYDGNPFSDEIGEMHRKLLAAMLGVKERPGE